MLKDAGSNSAMRKISLTNSTKDLDALASEAIQDGFYPLADVLLMCSKRQAKREFIDPSFALRQLRHQQTVIKNKFPLINLWRILLTKDLRHDPGRCVGYSLKLDKALRPEHNFSELVQAIWSYISDPHEGLNHARINIAHCAHSPLPLSEDCIAYLYDHPTTSPRIRHLITAGCAATFNDRNISKQRLKYMLDNIGERERPHSQKILESFRSSAYKAFSLSGLP